ncbi:MAG TPA: prepilin peptidase, partial [Vicinamibacterales bacterium]|nr:prepilin peptidase [Vicinamibacterales bacterium]
MTFQLLLGAAIGLCIGSFLNVVIYRLPIGQSIVTPPSRCRTCGYQLRWYDNIPVLSWVFLRGRCRKCGVSVSIQY